MAVRIKMCLTILLVSGIIALFVKVTSGDADVTIQLLSYSNPSFGLAEDNFYCAYQSPSIPPPTNPRASLPVLGGQQNGQQQQGLQGQSQQGQGQGYPQQYQSRNQYPQNQANQQQQYRQNQQYPPGQQAPQYQQSGTNQQYGTQGQAQYGPVQNGQAQDVPQLGRAPYGQVQSETAQVGQSSFGQLQGQLPNGQSQGRPPNGQPQFGQPQGQPQFGQSQQSQFGQSQQSQYRQNGQQPQYQQNQQYPQYGQQQQGQQGQGQPYRQGAQQFQQNQGQYQQNQGYQQNPQLQQQLQQQQLQQPLQQQSMEMRQIQSCVEQQREFTVPNWNDCRLSFATVFATYGDGPLVLSTGLIPLSSNNATIDFTQTTWNDKCNWNDCADRTWTAPRILRFKVKPNFIEIVITHFGDAVFGNNGGFVTMNNAQARLVDTISVKVANLTPAAAAVNPPPVYSLCVNGDQRTSAGYPLSKLTLTISIKCRIGFYGQFCNLTNCTAYNNETHVCLSSAYPGQSLACGYDSVNLQPINCTLCPYGIQDGKCLTIGSLHQSENTSLVGYIIGLALLGLLLAIALALLVILVLTRRRDRDQPANRKYQQQPKQTPSSGWAPSFLGTKAKKGNNGNGKGKGGYTMAPTEPAESEWQPSPRTLGEPPQAPIYSLPHPPARPPQSNDSTPEHNGSRREAVV